MGTRTRKTARNKEQAKQLQAQRAEQYRKQEELKKELERQAKKEKYKQRYLKRTTLKGNKQSKSTVPQSRVVTGSGVRAPANSAYRLERLQGKLVRVYHLAEEQER